MQLDLYKERQQSNENSQQIKAAEAFQSLVLLTMKIIYFILLILNTLRIQYMNELTDIVNKSKLKNEAEFVIAYQNHMKKIKAELKELSSKHNITQLYEIKLRNNAEYKIKIKQMLQIMIMNQDECLKLYQKVEMKSKENYELRYKLTEMQKTNDFLEQQIKSLMKKIKQQEIDKELLPNVQLEQIFCTTTPSNQQKYNKRRLTEIQPKVELSSTLSKHHQSSIKEMFPVCELYKENLKYEDLVDKFTKYVTIIEQKYQNQNKILNEKVQKLLISQNKKSIIRSDLEYCFLECVDAVRREIQKKRPLGNFQQYYQLDILFIIYQLKLIIFWIHHINHIKLLLQQQILINLFNLTLSIIFRYYIRFLIVLQRRQNQNIRIISNEKLLVFIYQKLFPNHVNLVLQSIKEDNNLKIFLDQTVKHSVTVNSNNDESLNINHLITHYKVEAPKTTREVRSVSLNKQLELRKGKLLFKQY